MRGTTPGENIPKSMFLWAKNMTFGPLGHVLILLKGPANSYLLLFFFKYEIYFIYWHIEPTSVPMLKSVTFRAPFALFKSPLNSSKTWIFKNDLFLCFICHIEPTCQILRIYNQKCEFWPLGPLLPFLKGPPNSSKTNIFKNINFFCFTLSHCA